MMKKIIPYLSGAVFLMLSLGLSCEQSGPMQSESPTTPSIVSSTPADGVAAVPGNRIISVTFSEAMEPATLTVTTFTVTAGEAALPIRGRVICDKSSATFLPTERLEDNNAFTATITTGASSALGVALPENYVWTFATLSLNDNQAAPTVTSTDPLDGATEVPPNSSVSVIFSEEMDSATFTESTFTLTHGDPPISVAGTVIYADGKAVFWPSVHLTSDTVYTATITTGAKNVAGFSLADNYVWTFTAGSINAPGLPVDLGTAGSYVILAKTGISTVATSAVTGNLGVSPAAATYITGFSLILDPTNVFSTSSQVTGKVYSADYAPPTPSNLTTAIGDLMLAFTDAAGRAPDVTELGAGDIGGMHLASGVYSWSSGLLIPTDITLTGSDTDIWIFQIAQNLTVSSGVNIVLAGGAMAKNIFWQVSGSVDIGTTAHIEGVVLSQTAINLRTGASINGRLLAQTAVTIDASAVVEPLEWPVGIFSPTGISSP